MKKALLSKTLLAASVAMVANLSFAGEFKRFSVSAGWLHVMPQGNTNTFNINTAAKEGTKSAVGNISEDSFFGALNPDYLQKNKAQIEFLKPLLPLFEDPKTGEIQGAYTGDATINGLEHWQNNAGLEADDVDTLGLTFNYYINDNVSLQLIGGIPPKVDIKGKGQIIAPLSGNAKLPDILNGIFPDASDFDLGPNELPLQKDIFITDLNKPKIASVRAWTPALEAQYQFGKSGVNKFRPYVGAGLMFAHFNDIKLNGQTRSDLEAAGNMIQNVLDGAKALDPKNNMPEGVGAGAALDGKTSSANPYVKVKADDAIAPIVSLGATYDMTENWYGVVSVSYAKLNNEAKIDVIDKNTGKRLIHAKTKIDIDPLITYVGVGYRF